MPRAVTKIICSMLSVVGALAVAATAALPVCRGSVSCLRQHMNVAQSASTVHRVVIFSDAVIPVSGSFSTREEVGARTRWTALQGLLAKMEKVILGLVARQPGRRPTSTNTKDRRFKTHHSSPFGTFGSLSYVIMLDKPSKI